MIFGKCLFSLRKTYVFEGPSTHFGDQSGALSLLFSLSVFEHVFDRFYVAFRRISDSISVSVLVAFRM